MKHYNIGVVELIDRTLNKGVILNADLVITVADVPLLAANLKLALASVETMLKYGIMTDWLMPVALNTKKNEKDKDTTKPLSPNLSNHSSPPTQEKVYMKEIKIYKNVDENGVTNEIHVYKENIQFYKKEIQLMEQKINSLKMALAKIIT